MKPKKKKPSLNRVTSTEFVETSLFSTGSRPGDNGGRGGGGHPYSEIRWRGEVSKNFFRPLQASKNKRRKVGPPGSSLGSSTAIIPFCVSFFLLCLFVFFSTSCINLATILWEAIPRSYHLLKGNMFLLMVSSAPLGALCCRNIYRFTPLHQP